jgi:hypothetical protein
MEQCVEQRGKAMPSELAFRAQLVLQEQREIFDYWRRCASGRAMPSRSDLDPVAIPHLLPGLSLLNVDPQTEEVRYRLAGTRVREIYGMEVTGKPVFDLDFKGKLSYWRAAYSRVIREGVPMQGAVRGPVAARDHLVLFWLRLPLGEEAGPVDRILGYDAAVPLSFAAREVDLDAPLSRSA